jgi:hypothetical protein
VSPCFFGGFVFGWLVGWSDLEIPTKSKGNGQSLDDGWEESVGLGKSKGIWFRNNLTR